MGGLSRIAIEGKVTGRLISRLFAWKAIRACRAPDRRSRLSICTFALAADGTACRARTCIRSGVNIIVAASIAAVEGDPHVLEESAILILELA